MGLENKIVFKYWRVKSSSALICFHVFTLHIDKPINVILHIKWKLWVCVCLYIYIYTHKMDHLPQTRHAWYFKPGRDLETSELRKSILGSSPCKGCFCCLAAKYENRMALDKRCFGEITGTIATDTSFRMKRRWSSERHSTRRWHSDAERCGIVNCWTFFLSLQPNRTQSNVTQPNVTYSNPTTTFRIERRRTWGWIPHDPDNHTSSVGTPVVPTQHLESRAGEPRDATWDYSGMPTPIGL
jgi:hypothetical protein